MPYLAKIILSVPSFLKFCQGRIYRAQKCVTLARGDATLNHKLWLVRHRHLHVRLINPVLLGIKSIDETALNTCLDFRVSHCLRDFATYWHDPHFLENATPLCRIGDWPTCNNHLA